MKNWAADLFHVAERLRAALGTGKDPGTLQEARKLREAKKI